MTNNLTTVFDHIVCYFNQLSHAEPDAESEALLAWAARNEARIKAACGENDPESAFFHEFQYQLDSSPAFGNDAELMEEIRGLGQLGECLVRADAAAVHGIRESSNASYSRDVSIAFFALRAHYLTSGLDGKSLEMIWRLHQSEPETGPIF